MKWLYLPAFALLLLFQSCASYQTFDAELAERLYQKKLAEENAGLDRLQNYKAQMLSAANRGEITQTEAADLIYKAEVDYDERKKQQKLKEKELSLEEDRITNDRIYQQQKLSQLQKTTTASPYTKQGATVVVNPSQDPLTLRCQSDGFGGTICRER